MPKMTTKEYQTAWRQAHAEAGLCQHCNAKAREGSMFCPRHLTKYRCRMEQRRHRLHAAGLCVACPVANRQPPLPGIQMCAACRTRTLARLARNRQARRDKRNRLAAGPAAPREDCHAHVAEDLLRPAESGPATDRTLPRL